MYLEFWGLLKILVRCVCWLNCYMIYQVADIKKMNGLVSDLQMFARKTLHISLPGRHPPSPILTNGFDTKGYCYDHYNFLAPPVPCNTFFCLTHNIPCKIVIVILSLTLRVAKVWSQVQSCSSVVNIVVNNCAFDLIYLQ